MEHSPRDTGPPLRRGPSVDLDPRGSGTGKRPDRQRRYGIDDQAFVVAFDSDYPQDLLHLAGRLRDTEASLCTRRDTPRSTCAKAPIDASLAQLTHME